MTEDLVRWLGEQLDTDEQIAREATGGPWRNAPTAQHHATATGRTEEAVFAAPPSVGTVIVASTGDASERQNLINAEHIAHHDPARVLREIDTKRRIIGAHKADTHGHCRACAHWTSDWVDGHKVERLAYGGVRAPCLTLRLLALPYADRPGYHEEWRP